MSLDLTPREQQVLQALWQSDFDREKVRIALGMDANSLRVQICRIVRKARSGSLGALELLLGKGERRKI